MKKVLLIFFVLVVTVCLFAQEEEYSFWRGENITSGLLDLDGNEVIPAQDKFIFHPLSDSYCTTDKAWDYFGYCDENGKEIIKAKTAFQIFPVNGMLPIIKWEPNSRIGVLDLQGNEIFPFKYVVEPNSTSFATLWKNTLIVQQHDKYGLVDLNDKVIIPFEYDLVRGDITLDYKMYLKTEKNGKSGYNNLDGSVILPCEYDFIGEWNYDVTTVQKGKYWGVVNIEGKFIIGPTDEYKKIYALGPDRALVQKNGKFGILEKGKLVLPCEYNCVLDDDPDLERHPELLVLSNAKEKFVIDKLGNKLFSCPLDYDFPEDDEFCISEDRIIFKQKGELYFDDNVVFYPSYLKHFQTKEEFYKYTKENTVECGIINEDNTYVFKNVGDGKEEYKFFNTLEEAQKYTKAHNIEFGHYIKKEAYGVLDTQGNLILKPAYERIQAFSDGMAVVSNWEYKEGAIDKDGNLVVPLEYDIICPFKNGMAVAEKENLTGIDNLYGVIDKENKTVMEFKYSEIERVGDRFVATYDYRDRLYNSDGKPISKEYDDIAIMANRSERHNFIFQYGVEPKPIKYLSFVNGCRDAKIKSDSLEDEETPMPAGLVGMNNNNFIFNIQNIISKISMFITKICLHS